MKWAAFALVIISSVYGLSARAGVDPDLFSGKAAFKAPLPMAELAPELTPSGEIADANLMDAEVNFEGRLTLTALVPGGSKIVTNDHAYGITNDSALAPPPFSFDIVSDEDRLYPTISLPLTDAKSGWEVLIGPGYIWRDPAVDGGRISFSFTLKEPNANCLHNGVVTLAFDHEGLKPLALYQIASETCAYFKFNLWGAMKVAFAPGDAPDNAAILAREADIRSHRLPTGSLSGLVADDKSLAKPFGDVTVDDPATSYGFVVDGTVYAGDCMTRMGINPLCADTDLPSYSTAKTVFASVALMRLEALYPGTAAAKISDHVPQCGDWGDVRLLDALDMATGRYDSLEYEVDEDAGDMADFFAPDTHAGRIAFACGHYKRKTDPGKTFVYHTADTYALGAAMQALYHEKTGGDLYDGVMAPLWSGLHLSARLDYAQRTNDPDGQPMTGYGLVYRRDDILRIANWYFGHGDGLDHSLHAQAIQKDASQPGLIAFPPNYRYQHGVWARNISPVAGCQREVWVPFMSGYGGITVAQLSPRITFYFFGDSQQFDWTQAIRTAQTFGDLCT